ncbi:ubiquitin-conjugating enzyme/RWD-like protein [Neohortaea acidophila]|uniref:Ubiquitin-conjugating enzyme/RWD-like protein n=1 Tax=Neohortaea acidophila TaxID=245834 RepID=A0A6A6PG55_9PEZI|nr:ubiquitin-conjugating enzyme/RWD-like protein [Neohortaea acidophila]KAF2478714.1 ubiquitin-conjugating enzyme/RWD-like protein [Neohortaea acidophila]
MAAKRLIKELDAYHSDPSPAVAILQPADDGDLLHLTAVLLGPQETAYEGGTFTLTLAVPPNYPAAPPDIRFRTPCCHPNVNFKTGEICLDLLKGSWTPAYGLISTLEAVQQLLSAGGNPDSPYNLDVARLMREGDLVGAEALVRFYTRLYAWGR